MSTAAQAYREHPNTISLREYTDVRFSEMEKRISIQMEAQRAAVSKAEMATENRFASVNEFRAQLGDQTRTLVPRPEVEQKFKSIDEKLDVLSNRLNSRDDRGRGMGEVWGYIVGALGVIALIAAFMRHTP